MKFTFFDWFIVIGGLLIIFIMGLTLLMGGENPLYKVIWISVGGIALLIKWRKWKQLKAGKADARPANKI